MIAVKNIVKKYEMLAALDDLSLDVADNEIFGLLGPNGAGKTTLIHILATLIKPTSGTATVNGYDILSQPSQVRSTIGIVFQAPSSDDMLTGYENLKLHSLLYGVDSEVREKRISEVLELVGLTDRKDHQVKKYSGGMRRRLEIARGLIHKPKVIFLDEPTLGLDPASREVMWGYIDRLVKEEMITIILTTHYMEEADYLCNRVGIIDKGKIIALDSPSRLKESLGGEIIRLIPKKSNAVATFEKGSINQKDYINYIREAVRQCQFIKKIEFDNEDDRTIMIYVDDASSGLPKILRILNSLAIEVESVDFKSPTLNDVFLRFTGKHIASDEDQPEGGFVERYAKYDNRK
jgi:ABC-2 type transport system ATP-binding protein